VESAEWPDNKSRLRAGHREPSVRPSSCDSESPVIRHVSLDLPHLPAIPSSLISPAVPNLFQRKAPKASIAKSPNGHQHRESHAAAGAHKVGLRGGGKGWTIRSYIAGVWLPSIFTRRTGSEAAPEFPKIPRGKIGVTWIGHASFLLQFPNHNLLIDPNWARWLKVVKRLRHPGVKLTHLPSIDLVLVTHAHFDHLDRRTLRRVAADQPIVVPFDVGNLVHDLGFRSVHELGYWESYRMGPVRVTLTPCHHWGARILHDSHRGFGGFIIQTGGRTIYHCGDTAYFPGFREIGRRFDIDVALLPIGAYDAPSGREVHMNPEQALAAFVDLGAKAMVPMHYGTFRLGHEPLDEPLRRLHACARANRLADRIVVMTEGQPEVF
jgi:L-ascorbate metabolism protein UlaG (beta-lactamase superfamily)